jgi:hypothetical protein
VAPGLERIVCLKKMANVKWEETWLGKEGGKEYSQVMRHKSELCLELEEEMSML